MSVSLSEVTYFATNETERDSTEQPIVKLKKLYLTLNIPKLLKGDLYINGLELEGGSIHLIQNIDSTFNIMNAIQILYEKGELKTKSDLIEENDTVQSDMAMWLNYVKLNNIHFNYKDQIDKTEIEIQIDNIVSSFNFVKETVSVQLDSKLHLIKLPFALLDELDHKNLHIETDLNINLKDNILAIEMAKINFDDALFDADGHFQYGDPKTLDVNFRVNDNNLSFTNLFLSESGVESIQKGSVYFNGDVKYNFIDEAPLINCKLELSDISFADQTLKHDIDNLNLKASFTSGKKDNFSDALLLIDTLYAVMPDGSLHASVKLENFEDPNIQSNIDLDLDIENLDKLFELEIVTGLNGRIALKINYDNKLISNKNPSNTKTNDIDLVFDKVSFKVPDLLDVNLLDGSLSGVFDSINIHDLKIISGNTDLFINATIFNASSLISEKEDITTTNFTIHSDRFDLPALVNLFYDSTYDFNESFPYHIINGDIEAEGSIIPEELMTADDMSFMKFDIKYVSGQIESFLPPGEARNGRLVFSEIDSTLVIDINDYDILFEHAKLHGGCTIYSGTIFCNDSIQINADIDYLKPDYFLQYYSSEPGNFSSSIALSGSINSSLKFADLDTTEDFEYLNTVFSDFHLSLPEDTLYIDGMKINISDIYYDEKIEPAPVAALTANIDLAVESLWLSYLQIDGLTSEIDIDEGVYTIETLKSETVFKNGEGSFVFAPYVPKPYFNINYSLPEFNFGDYYNRLDHPPLVSGSMNALFQVEGEGKDWEVVIRNINGKIVINGEEIKIKGIKLDRIIFKLNRSTKFNLLNIGALVVAGPAGLLVTKGADITSLLINSKKDSTLIGEFITEQEITNGNIDFHDVAFTTTKNLIASRGTIDMPTDSMGIVTAVLDKNGKVRMHQPISGKIEDPKVGEFRPIKDLLTSEKKSWKVLCILRVMYFIKVN